MLERKTTPAAGDSTWRPWEDGAGCVTGMGFGAMIGCLKVVSIDELVMNMDADAVADVAAEG